MEDKSIEGKVRQLKSLVLNELPEEQRPHVTDLNLMLYMVNYAIAVRVLDLMSVYENMDPEWIDVCCYYISEADYFHMKKLTEHLMYVSKEPTTILKDSALEKIVSSGKIDDYKRFTILYCGYMLNAAEARYKQLVIN